MVALWLGRCVAEYKNAGLTAATVPVFTVEVKNESHCVYDISAHVKGA